MLGIVRPTAGRGQARIVIVSAVSLSSEREAGVLLPLPALPGPGRVGELGAGARRFIDLLAEAGVRWWQILPLGPTSATRGHSPYSALSAFALDPLFIALDELVDQGLLDRARVHARTQASPSTGRIDYAGAWADKQAWIEAAARARAREDRAGIERFADTHAWVHDWARFVVLGRVHGERWQSWPTPLRQRDALALAQVDRDHAAAIEEVIAVQLIAHEQWARLRAHASARGVRLFGDLPIYVVAESADVWARRDGFSLDHDAEPRFESGVPPDDFSADGQRWESPVYDWQAMAADDFSWWRERLACEASRLDLLRLDHFRGFAAYWQIPRGASAKAGEWIPGPGMRLFERVFEQIDPSFFVAEDLGIIDEPVRELLAATGLPGMRVLQFGFGGGVEHQVEQHPERCVAYTGTHDNDTLRGWWKGLDARTCARVLDYVGRHQDPPQALLERLLGSRARLAIVPLQDLLGLGSEARINTPGRAKGNWCWRAREDQLDVELIERTSVLLRAAGRLR